MSDTSDHSKLSRRQLLGTTAAVAAAGTAGTFGGAAATRGLVAAGRTRPR